MILGRQRIIFEGLLQKNVLGTFDVIRGFGDLRDLAEVSVTMPYEGSGLGSGTGYQRDLDEAHVEGSIPLGVHAAPRSSWQPMP